MGQGRLYLVPTPLDFGCELSAPLSDVLPARTIAAAAGLTHWVCENAKSARAFLKRVGEVSPLAAPLQQQAIVELPRAVHKKGDHGPAAFDAKPLLLPALQGHDLGLLSEAGMPAIADPGSSVVRAAHDLGVQVARGVAVRVVAGGPAIVGVGDVGGAGLGHAGKLSCRRSVAEWMTAEAARRARQSARSASTGFTRVARRAGK